MDMRNFYVLFCMAAGGMVFANATSPVHNRVIDFVPAPGQFVNAIPEWEEGDDADAMAEKAYCYTAEDGSMVSLGAWGGYITVGFETTIVNADGKRDIYIEGNAFDAANGVSTLLTGGSSEPGVVMVAYDINGNGMPDDNEWFEIAGSEYSNSIHNYEITYYRPASDDDDIRWTDNNGNSGYVYKNQFHIQPYWPQWMNDKETLTFIGTRLPDNGKNQGDSDSPYYVLERFDWGYADNAPNLKDDVYNNDVKIDIDWAVDKNGNAVKMPGVDFVRIYTGVNQANGWIGENSTEVMRVMNAHTVDGRDGDVDESIKIDSQVLADFLAKYPNGNASVSEISNDNVRIYVDRSGMVHFSLNEPAVVQIFDQAGRLCHFSEQTEGECFVSLADYPSGLYIVRAGSAVQKILKK